MLASKRRSVMAYTKDDLKSKLLAMYPEITKYGLSLSVEFDEDKNAWIVTFEKEMHQRHAILDKKDADACIDGNVCIYLGMLITQYLRALEEEIAG
jgi:hypothetical protein